jgi:hypothetical protein
MGDAGTAAIKDSLQRAKPGDHADRQCGHGAGQQQHAKAAEYTNGGHHPEIGCSGSVAVSPTVAATGLLRTSCRDLKAAKGP